MEGNLYWAEQKVDGKLVHISEVMKGKQCNCLCPACRSPLVARQGSVNTWHFAHLSEHPCNQGAETALHQLAKKIIEAGTSIRLPSGRRFDYTSVLLEKPMQGIRPDICVGNGTEELLIEIFVSSKVTPRKEQLIHCLGLLAMEIDLSQVRQDISEAELRILILEQIENKRMLAVTVADSQLGEDTIDFPSSWLIALLVAVLVTVIMIFTRNRRPSFSR